MSTTGEGDIIISGCSDPKDDFDCTIVLDINDFYKGLRKWLKKSEKLFDKRGCYSCGAFVAVHVCEYWNEEEVKNNPEETPLYYCHILKVEMCKGKKCWSDEEEKKAE